jgi:transposase-like protein
MNTREMAQEVRLANWTGIVRARRDSGLSVRCYCQEQGINEKTYYYWQRRLRETAFERLACQEMSPHHESPVFAALPTTSSRDSGSIVIRLNGAEVEIRGEANTAAVEIVLKALQGC